MSLNNKSYLYFVLGIVRSFGCFRCGKSYKRKETLSRHLRLECGTFPQFACAICNFRFKRKEHLTSHLRSKHAD